jgi:hypothetical protein
MRQRKPFPTLMLNGQPLDDDVGLVIRVALVDFRERERMRQRSDDDNYWVPRATHALNQLTGKPTDEHTQTAVEQYKARLAERIRQLSGPERQPGRRRTRSKPA